MGDGRGGSKQKGRRGISVAEISVSQPDVRDNVGRAVGVIQESTATAVEHNNPCQGESVCVWGGGRCEEEMGSA